MDEHSDSGRLHSHAATDRPEVHESAARPPGQPERRLPHSVKIPDSMPPQALSEVSAPETDSISEPADRLHSVSSTPERFRSAERPEVHESEKTSSTQSQPFLRRADGQSSVSSLPEHSHLADHPEAHGNLLYSLNRPISQAQPLSKPADGPHSVSSFPGRSYAGNRRGQEIQKGAPYSSRPGKVSGSSPSVHNGTSTAAGSLFTRTCRWNEKEVPVIKGEKRHSRTSAAPPLTVEPQSRAHQNSEWHSCSIPLQLTAGKGGPGKAPGRQTAKGIARSRKSPVSRGARFLSASSAVSAAKQPDEDGAVQDSGGEILNKAKDGASAVASQAAQRMVRQIRKRQVENAAEKGAASTVKKGIAGLGQRLKGALRILTAKAKPVIVFAAVFLLILFLIFTGTSSLMTVIGGGFNTVASVTFGSSDADIDKAEAYYTSKEADLQKRIGNIKQEYPGYDEYDYYIGTIGHVPLQLIAYLSTEYGDFTFDTVKSHLDDLFNTQYKLTLTSQTQTKTTTGTDPNTGQQVQTQQPCKILTVNLNAQDFTAMLTNLLSKNNRIQQFTAYLQAFGNRQYFKNPLPFGWSMYAALGSNNVTALDIPSGTQVTAALAGTVTKADDGTVTISGTDGLSATYGNCASIQVSQGQTVGADTGIATTGAGFSMLFQRNGEHLNPYLFVDTGVPADNGTVTVGGQPIGGSVEACRAAVTQLAPQYGMQDYVNLILAVMQQESGGRGGDPMQAAEGPFNTRYPKCPNGITDPAYSIQCGIQELKQNLQLAGCTSPSDTAGIELALQGYNYGSGFISWAKGNGGYTLANALRFSQQQAASLHWSSYGDPYYVPHVMRYYKQ